MRRRLLHLTAALSLVLGLGPAAGALPVLDGASVPVLTTDNVEVVGAVPDASLVAVTFDPEKPVMYGTALNGFKTYDISNPELPMLMDFLPFPHFSNENIKLGVREDGTRLVMAGFDLVGYSPDAGATNTRGSNRFVVIDVTDAEDLKVASTVNTNTRTHTMGCANAECTFAYTSGSGSSFQVYDLSDITKPVEVNRVESIQGPNTTFRGGIGHDWDVDDNGVAWLVGTGGITAFDVSDPASPVILNTSNDAGSDDRFNRYVSHNSQRPNADAFEGRAADELLSTERDEDTGLTPRDPADLAPGEVLFVTEEDLSSDPRCNNRGGFQAWHVQELDADRYAEANPGDEVGELEPDQGSITPIGKWTTESGEVNDPVAAADVGAFCSAHYFDIHADAGIAAHAWYQQGLRFLDVRDPTNIKQIGFFITGAQEIFGAKWVPEYDEDGQTGAQSNIVYTEDVSRGIDILRVDLDLPDTQDTAPVRAPILPEWKVTGPALAARASGDFGFACLLP